MKIRPPRLAAVTATAVLLLALPGATRAQATAAAESPASSPASPAPSPVPSPVPSPSPAPPPVSTAEGRVAGKLAWAELLTSGEPARSARFYENVFGWRAEVSGSRHAARVRFFQNDVPVAGVSFRDASEMGPARARWVLFFGVPDVAAAAARAGGAGGRALLDTRPAPMPGDGELAVLADPEGATFGLLSAAPDGSEIEEYATEPGRWIWPLLFARDPDVTGRFYEAVLGLELTEEKRTPLFAGDFVLARGPRARAALMALPRDTSGRPAWLGLLRVADLEETVMAVRISGGTILKGPTDDLIGGRIAVAADPEGGVFGLVELSSGAARNATPHPSRPGAGSATSISVSPIEP